MSTNVTQANKAEPERATPGKDDMLPCGTTMMRESTDSRSVGDQINGTINLKDPWLESIGAGAGDRIWIHAEANGKELDTVLKIHANSRSVTLPKEKRQKLDLEPGDEIKYWIAKADSGTQPESDNKIQQTLSEDENNKMMRVIVLADNPFTYHLSDKKGKTACGIKLSERGPDEYREGTEDMREIFDPCLDCIARDSAEMTNDELIEWFRQKVGFERDGNTRSYMSKSGLMAVRDGWLELEDKIAEKDEELNKLKDGLSAER
jgi:bifunctional DNA-binding transcriptional regulator/antitoxin component of YhaV-PrlF toxin-antitoxin module